jgi:hypothetical protein
MKIKPQKNFPFEKHITSYKDLIWKQIYQQNLQIYLPLHSLLEEDLKLPFYFLFHNLLEIELIFSSDRF